jgi:glycerate 2-kinase
VIVIHMQVLVCPTAFKGTLTSLEAALALAEAVRDRLHSALVLPLGDGGDGTYESLLRGDLGWKEVLVSGVLDPLGRPVDSRYLLKENKAFIQMSLASGMALLKR